MTRSEEFLMAISRQAVKEYMIKKYGFYAPDMTVSEFVEDLPSVTPKQKMDFDGMTDRLISEQAALDAICKVCAVVAKPSECRYRKGLFGGCEEYEAIKAIPSSELQDGVVLPEGHGRLEKAIKAIERMKRGVFPWYKEVNNDN